MISSNLRPNVYTDRVLATAGLALALGGACADDPDPDPDNTDTTSATELAGTYVHRLFENPKDCPDDPLFNCAPSVKLCSNGDAYILVTDIINRGTYAREGSAVRTTWGPADVPSTIDFEPSEDGLTLRDTWLGWSWNKGASPLALCPGE